MSDPNVGDPAVWDEVSAVAAARKSKSAPVDRSRSEANVGVVDAYFAAMCGRDAASHRKLFTQDAELVTPVGTFNGVDAIVDFYRDFAFVVDDLRPEPGPFIISDDRVAVELRARANGIVSLVADFFTIRDGKIARLAIYTGPPDPGT